MVVPRGKPIALPISAHVQLADLKPTQIRPKAKPSNTTFTVGGSDITEMAFIVAAFSYLHAECCHCYC